MSWTEDPAKNRPDGKKKPAENKLEEQKRKMKDAAGKARKTVLFVCILFVLLAAATKFLQPLFRDQYDRESDFYKQEKNTIETIFLGSSVVYMGISPMELYADYGICSYNLATNSQPVLTSWYWLLEVYDYHPDTLKTVVLDVSMLKRDTAESAYQKALWGMRGTSVNKYHAVRDITDTLEDFFSYMFPLYSWHSRWSELEEGTAGALLSDQGSYMRGYYFSTKVMIEREDYDEIGMPGYYLDEEATGAGLFDEAVIYFDKIVSFCEEHDIQLVLIKTPCSTDVWTDAQRNIVEEYVGTYGLEILDFNYSPLLEELDYNAALDLTDDRHLNYEGACRLTDWIGEYLTTYCGATDVRGDEDYAFMDEQLEQYQAYIEENTDEDNTLSEEDAASLTLYNIRCEDERTVKALHVDEETTLSSYLSGLMEQDDYILLLSSQDETADLSADETAALEELGLTELANLTGGVWYASVVTADGVEETVASGSGEAKLVTSVTTKGGESEEESEAETSVDVIVTGGTHSLIVVDGGQYSLQEDGLNIVVYNRVTGLVIDAVTFTTDGELYYEYPEEDE